MSAFEREELLAHWKECLKEKKLAPGRKIFLEAEIERLQNEIDDQEEDASGDQD